MENIKKFLSDNKIFLITLSISVIVTSSTMILLYKNNHSIKTLNNNLSITDNFVNELEPYATKLTSINSSLKKCIKGTTIDTKSTLNILNDSLKNLSSLKEKVSATVINNNKNPDIIPKFISSIEATENLYKYCIESLSYSNDLSSSEITSQILLLKDNCNSSYEALYPYGLSVEFPSESEEFLDDLIGYLNAIDKLNKEDIIKTNQYNSYIEKLTKCTNSFSDLLEDLEPAIKLIRKDNRSFDIILDDIRKKEDELSNIKRDFNYSSIPEGCISYYNSMNNIFSLYSTYLNSLKIAVIYEKSSSSYEKNKTNIDKYYENAFSKYEDVKTSFKSLLSSF